MSEEAIVLLVCLTLPTICLCVYMVTSAWEERTRLETISLLTQYLAHVQNKTDSTDGSGS